MQTKTDCLMVKKKETSEAVFIQPTCLSAELQDLYRMKYSSNFYCCQVIIRSKIGPLVYGFAGLA